MEGRATRTKIFARSTLNTILRIAITLVAIQMLVDFAFYGRHPNDLAGAAGFVLLLIGSRATAGSVGADGRRVRNVVSARIIATAGALLVGAHFVIKWIHQGT